MVKLLATAFVPYAPMELSNMSLDEFTRTVRVERNLANNMQNQSWRELVNDGADELRDELIAMVKAGYQFHNHKIT